MLLSKTAIVKWHPKTYKHYIEKGYIFNGIWGEEFEIKVKYLTKGSYSEILVKCDYCGKEYPKAYITYLIQNKKAIIHKDCCENCIQIKREESFLKTYGVKNAQDLPITKEHTKQTCLEKYSCEHHASSEHTKNKRKENNLLKYNVENVNQLESIKEKKKQSNLKSLGVENPFQSEIVKQKIIQHYLDVYGVEYYSQTDECREKMRQTCLNRYNVEYVMQSDEIKLRQQENNLKKYGVKSTFSLKETREKIKQTNLIRFGYDNPNKNKKVRAKIAKTLYENSSQKASNQQKYICNLLNGKLNYPVDGCSLDILLDDFIFIEYQGSGHDLSVKFGSKTQEEFDKKEVCRKYFLYRRGYKEIEIISRKDKIPSDEIILQMINFAKEYILTGHSWITFDIDNSTVKSSQFEQSYDFGTLRKIKKSDLQKIS